MMTLEIMIYIPVVPGQAGGGSFHPIKKHKPIRTCWPIEKNNQPRAAFFSGKPHCGTSSAFGCDDLETPRSPQRHTWFALGYEAAR